MIKKEDIVEIGKFRKTHALKGELNASLDIDPDYVQDEKPLIVEMDGILVPFYADTIRQKGSDSFLVKLKDINSEEEARQFVNREIYALRTDLIDYYDDPDMELKEDFLDYMIIDKEHGTIGKIVDIDDSTDNILFVVESENKNIYIPVAEEFIVKIDHDKMTIETDLPSGLLDLN